MAAPVSRLLAARRTTRASAPSKLLGAIVRGLVLALKRCRTVSPRPHPVGFCQGTRSVALSIEGDIHDDGKVGCRRFRTIMIFDSPRSSRERDAFHTPMLLVAELRRFKQAARRFRAACKSVPPNTTRPELGSRSTFPSPAESGRRQTRNQDARCCKPPHRSASSE
jgi:hypothetical protein